ncbi:hypothetical protein B0H15DRAFT_952665 [Mycena belliarum]|uniref:Uncharacterized protein n=1 Tax=Mycena belliarum TaxID=1033014 RepID=A0AAD6U016_9AGAR|nr:hypothetical protein B0H15DRAFT_952665 [Mycena belliae]
MQAAGERDTLAAMTIAFKEKTAVMVDQLVASVHANGALSTGWASTGRCDSSLPGKMTTKYTITTAFEITNKTLGPTLFASTACETLDDKMQLYFQDFSLTTPRDPETRLDLGGDVYNTIQYIIFEHFI